MDHPDHHPARRRLHRRAVALAACCAMLPSAHAGAAPAEPADPESAARPARGATTMFAAAAVSAERLAASRAGTSTGTIDIAGTLKDATATGTVAGANVIRDNSFANALGINTVIQNSGANVLIQNSTVVNVQLN